MYSKKLLAFIIKKKKILLAGIIVIVLFGGTAFSSYQIGKSAALKEIKEKEYTQHLNVAKFTHIAVDINKKEEVRDDFPVSEYTGIGILFRIKLDIVVIDGIIKGSPANLAGLQLGDKIVMIDGKYVSEMTAAQISIALKGELGTKVTLHIYRDSFGDRGKDFTITRDLITQNLIEKSMLEDRKEIAYDFVAKEWELVSGNPKDTCSRPKYSGNVTISGWYEWGKNYTTEDWLFRVDEESAKKLIKGYNGLYSISNKSSDLIDKLKKSSKEKPVSIQIKEMQYYCEGVPWLVIND